MPRMTGLLSVCLISVALPSMADVKVGSVEQLLRQCRGIVEFKNGDPVGRDDYVNFGFCMGRIEGVSFGMVEVATHANNLTSARRAAHNAVARYGLCIAADVGVQQQVAVFVNWAKANPEHWRQPYINGLLTAWQEAWPCEK